MKRQLPAQVLQLAFTATNGELAWRREDLPGAFQAIAASGQAVLGGEIWAIVDGSIHPVIPLADGPIPGIWHWETKPRLQHEPWPEFCTRAVRESLEAVNAMGVEAEVHPRYRDHLYFNVTYVADGE